MPDFALTRPTVRGPAPAWVAAGPPASAPSGAPRPASARPSRRRAPAARLAIPAIALALTLSLGCGESHTPVGERDGSVRPRDGGGARDDGGAPLGDAGRRRDGGGPIGVDAAPPPIDVLEECIDACDHLSSCGGDIMRLECIDDCIGIRDHLGTLACERLVREIFACLEGLSCAEIRLGLDRSRCAPVLDRWERECADTPPDPEPPPPRP